MNLDNMAVELRRHGLKVVEVNGWITRGYAQQDLKEVRGVLWHHTATNRARFVGNDCPTLGMLINGRPDVTGPLCNLAFGRDGTVYVVATGVANHAGAGVAANIPRDWGNHYLIGIEMESSGIAPWDWTAEQIYWAPRLGAALELIYLQGLPPERRLQISHQEYSSQGKIDPAGWPGGMDGLRNAINGILGGGSAPAPVAPVAKPAPAPAPAPVKQGNGKVPYCTIEAGDTGLAVARQFGVSFDRMKAFNPGVNWNALSIGQRIYLVNWCRVEAGDTGYGVAAQMGISFEQLSAYNPGVNWNALKVGQELWLE
jgi:LysM repeat protein